MTTRAAHDWNDVQCRPGTDFLSGACVAAGNGLHRFMV
jgi:hypothetical protein